MEFTGERMIPEYNMEDIIFSEHLVRYKFACQFVANKKVIDVACGSGYGTNIIAKARAKEVTGVDISKEAIEYANQNYKEKNSEYIEADATQLPLENNSFEVAVSFETIEHLEKHQDFLNEITRVIKKDGLLVISSPNKAIYPEGNEYHYREFTKKEFLTILKKKFKHVKIFQQNNYLISSLFENENTISKNKNELINNIKAEGMYFVAVCSNNTLPAINTQNLIASPEEVSSQAVVKEREKHIKILQKEIDELKGHIEYFKNNSATNTDIVELQNILKEKEKDLINEQEKNEYLYHSVQRDSARFEELISIIKEKELIASTLQEEKNSIQQNLIKLNTSIDSCTHELNVLKNEKESIKEELKTLKEIEKKYYEEREKTEYLYRINKEKEGEVNSLLKDNNEIKESIFKLESEKEELKSRLSLNEEKRIKLKNTIEELKILEKKYIEEKEKTEYLYRVNKEKEFEINSLTNENSSLKESQSNFNVIQEDLLQRIENMNSTISENEKILNEKGFIINSLEEKCKDYEVVNNELKILQNKISDYIITIKGLNIKLSESEEKLKLIKNNLTDKNQLIVHNQKEKEKLENKINESILIIKEKDDFIHHLNNSIIKLEQELVANKNTILSYENTLNDNIIQIENLEQNIVNINKEKRSLDNALSDKDDKIHILYSKQEMLQGDINALHSSISWRITLPLRLFFQLIVLITKPFLFLAKDSKYAIELLFREGFKSFIYRFFWYFRGKRLIEDIQYTKNKNIYQVTSASSGKKSIITFDRIKKPTVSIIIPVYNQWDYTYNCLNSIYENTKGIDYEIIVADDVSNDETVNIKNYIKNIKVVRNKENQRFLLNCNNAAKYAKGEYVLFLNNDTSVHNDWLKYLLDIFVRYENVGAAGAKLVYEDGRLQEAGGIMWDDASGWNFGRLGDPQMSEFNYVKEIDYISGACLMIPRKIWKKLGGFDKHFVPAYYEDTDICFQIRAEGYKVLYQPKSVVTHYEGISNGTDETTGQKKYQVTNHKKFFLKWKNDLQSFHFKNAENVFLARERSRNKKQILVIDHYVPHYDKDAGSRSTFSYLKLLVKMGFNVKFIGDNFFKHEPYTTELEQLGIEVLYGDYYFNNAMEWLKENGKYFDYVFAHRMHIAPKYFEVLRKYSKAKIIYIGHDLQFIKSKKEYEFSKDKEHLKNHEKFKKIETAIFNTVDIIYPFSNYEAPLIKEIVPNKVVRDIPVYFFDNEYQQKNGYDQRKDILFVGGFGHPPNIDAILWFTSNVLPKVLKENPEIVFHIVGSNPPKEIETLKSKNINVTGFVTDEELQEYYEKCRVSVIPLRVGAGVKGKLLETMYYKLPTVITTVAAEGVPDVEKACLITDNNSIFAKNILELYNNKSKWNDYSNKGNSLIKNHFTMDNAEKILSLDLV